MLLLVLALAAALLGGWYAFTHELQPLAIVLVAVAFGLVFVIGRRIEGQRDTVWQDTAAQWQARFEAAPGPQVLRAFGAAAPWDAWAQGGPLQCARTITGTSEARPFAIVQVRYPVRATHGEDAPDQWQEVVVAAVRHAASQPAGGLKPVDAGPAYEAADNGEWLFVWRKPASGSGEQATSSGLGELLQQAQRTLRRLPAGAATPRA